MTDLSNWRHYYNLEGEERVRANLVYTPYVSPDNKTFCMSFNRDPAYHINEAENAQWTEELLAERFWREIKFHTMASFRVPTLKVLDIDIQKRQIFLKWYGDDFYTQGLKAGGYYNVLPDWQTQWKQSIMEMWDIGITKMSLHPNSWTVEAGVLIPFNWFFSYDCHDSLAINDVIIQISKGRQEKLITYLESQGLNLETPYSVVTLQNITFNSFRSNYPDELIDDILKMRK